VSNLISTPPIMLDMTEEEKLLLQKYIEDGLPGISTIREKEIMELFSLYMANKSHKELADISGFSLEKVLFLAKKFSWHEKKLSYYNNLQTKMLGKMENAKLETANFVVDLLSFTHKMLGNEITEFLKTGDKAVAKKIDMRVLGNYFKSVELLTKLMSQVVATAPSDPKITINLGDATVERTGENSIKVTGNSTLQELAKKKRQEEQEKTIKK
jgi:hypothetical protein